MPDSILEAVDITEKTEFCSHEAFILIWGDLSFVYSHLGENEETKSVLEKE